MSADSDSIINQLSKDQIQQFKSLFNLIDQDHDSKITVKDLKTTMCNVGMDNIDDEAISKMIEQPNVEMNFSVFLKLMCSKYGEFTDKDSLKQAFAVFKATGGGDGLVCDSKDLTNSLVEVAGSDTSEDQIKQVVKDFSKSNDMTGDSYFAADKFIDTVKN